MRGGWLLPRGGPESKIDRAWEKQQEEKAKLACRSTGWADCAVSGFCQSCHGRTNGSPKRFAKRLRTLEPRTFRDDRDIGGGDDIPEIIRRQIIRSNEVVVLLTPESVDRQWVLFEVGAAWGRKQNARIIAVLCHVEVDTIPDLIKSKKAISINSFDEYLEELKHRVEKHVK